MIHISLFSGIGGFDIAAEAMGWTNGVSCEINPFGSLVLEFYWPEAYHHNDIHTLNYETINDELSRRFGKDWRKQGVVISGGFPCQPYSAAGKRLGKEDDRHLWPEMLRVIREVAPTYVVGENVGGIISWNGGLVFEEVQADLEDEGYEVQPVVLPAASVNAPHRRDRVWIIAHRNSNGDRQEHGFPTRGEVFKDGVKGSGSPTDSNGKRQQEQGQPKRPFYSRTGSEWKASWAYNDGRWPTQPPVCSRDDGLSPELVGITVPKHRRESIKAYGNAVVPQVVYQIFKAINIHFKNNH